jgi:gliding motility-associated-like protein
MSQLLEMDLLAKARYVTPVFTRRCVLFFIFFLGLSCMHPLLSQGYGNWWYFGDQGGLDFTNGTPVSVTGSLVTQEGCSSISDAAGNLQLYTDGSTVYANTHTVMSNGTGLLGHNSTAQSAVIVKQPGNTNIFYIFTMGVSNTGSLNYSVVDMSLASGHGSVTIKNTYLHGPCLEKLTAVKHSNNSDVWILVHESGTSTNFRAYLLTSAGVNTTAVVSNVGANGNTQSIGYLRASPDGQHVASAFYGGGTPAVELYDFNRSSGTLSNPIQLPTPYTVYGCEFSPDGTKLYASSSQGYIGQWQICLGTATAIAASHYSMSATNNWAMQLGPDGKIYVSRYLTSVLGVVNNPNLSGSACNYVDQSFTITGTCRLGLPNYVTSWFMPPPPNYTVTIGTPSNGLGCMTASFTSPATASINLPGCTALSSSVTGIKWNFGDPLSGTSNTSSASNPIHHYSSLGTFTTSLILFYSAGGGSDTLTQTLQITQPCITVNSTSITCSTLGSATVLASGGIGPFNYTWMPVNQTGSVATNLSPGSYTIAVYDQGTSQTYTSQVIFTSVIPLTGNFANQTDLLCPGAHNGTASVSNIAGGSPNQTFNWTDGTNTYTSSSVNTLGAGIWTVTVTDVLTGCQISNVFLVIQPPPLVISIAKSSPTACVASNVTFTAMAGGGTPGQITGYTYTWLPSNFSDINVVNETLPGLHIYTVSAADSNLCILSRTTSVTFIARPVLTVTGSSICPLQTGTVSASGASSYTWSSSATTSLITDNPLSTTMYTVTGETAACTSTSSGFIYLKNVPVPLISANSPLCENTNLQIFANGGSTYLWTGPASFNSSLQNPIINNIGLNNAGVYNVTVTAANNCTASASETVVVNAIPTLSAGGSTVCTTQNAILTSTSSASTFTWVGPLGFNSTNQNPSWLSSQTGATGYYTVTAQSAQGCTLSATAHVSVIMPPQLSLVASQPSFCAQGLNGSVSSITLSPSGASTYTLTTPPEIANTNPSGTIMPVFALPPYNVVNTVHTVTLEGSNGICASILSYTIKVVPNPTVIINDAAPAICEGQEFDFNLSGANAYVWTSSVPQFTFYGNGSSAKAGPPSTAQFQVYGSMNGCYSATENMLLTVNALPLLDPVSASIDLCRGSSTRLGVKGTATSFTWVPSTYLDNANSATPLANPPSDFTYSVVGSANNCTAETQVSIMVLPLPTPKAWVSKAAVCVDETFSLSGSGGNTYVWRGPDGSLYGGKDVELIAYLPHKGQFTLSVTDNAGCTNTAVTSLTVNDLPGGTLVGEKTGCVPFCTALTFQSFSSDQIESSWEIGSKKYATTTFTACFNKTGEQRIKGSLRDLVTGCHNTAEVIINPLPLPHADFSWLPEKPIAGYEAVQLTENTSGDNLEFTWYFLNDQLSAKGPAASFEFNYEGHYPVALVVQDKAGCFDSIVKYIDVLPDFIFFMPNSFTPNGDNINDLLFPVTGGLKKYQFSIYDRWGEKMFESFEPGIGWNGTFRNKNCKQDVYVWAVSLTNNDGENKTYKGTVMLLR